MHCLEKASENFFNNVVFAQYMALKILSRWQKRATHKTAIREMLALRFREKLIVHSLNQNFY
jgi:hypothetical protein